MAYMEKIGFGDQPFLVYKHTDVTHTHVHIATINIKQDGERIDTHGIGWKLSEPARVQLEKEFALVQAKGRQSSNSLAIKPANIEKVIYGRVPTKRAITNIVNAVISTYKFTSLAEFNAILKQFNVIADRGDENTVMRQKGGLIYSIINNKGEQVGVPIKASSIYQKPVLATLEKEFLTNVEKRKQYKEPLRNNIDKIFVSYAAISKQTFVAEMQKQNISVVFRTNEQGYNYGVTYIDNNSKAVFNGSDLGKTYSAKAISDRLSSMDIPLSGELKKMQGTSKNITPSNDVHEQKAYLKPPEPTNYLKLALSKYQPEAAPSITRKRKKKKNKVHEQGQGLNQ